MERPDTTVAVIVKEVVLADTTAVTEYKGDTVLSLGDCDKPEGSVVVKVSLAE